MDEGMAIPISTSQATKPFEGAAGLPPTGITLPSAAWRRAVPTLPRLSTDNSCSRTDIPNSNGKKTIVILND